MKDRTSEQMIAKGNTRKIIRMVNEVDDLIGRAHALHANDRDPNGFEKAQNCLIDALGLCRDIRDMYDPVP